MVLRKQRKNVTDFLMFHIFQKVVPSLLLFWFQLLHYQFPFLVGWQRSPFTLNMLVVMQLNSNDLALTTLDRSKVHRISRDLHVRHGHTGSKPKEYTWTIHNLLIKLNLCHAGHIFGNGTVKEYFGMMISARQFTMLCTNCAFGACRQIDNGNDADQAFARQN